MNSWGAVELGSEHTGLGSEWGDGLVSESPEAPEHSCAEDKTSAGAMENHVGLPSVFHVACTRDLEKTEEYPQEEEDETVGEREEKAFLLVRLEVSHCGDEGGELFIAELGKIDLVHLANYY